MVLGKHHSHLLRSPCVNHSSMLPLLAREIEETIKVNRLEIPTCTWCGNRLFSLICMHELHTIWIFLLFLFQPQLMKEVVTEGEELLPHRTSQSNLCNEENDQPNLEARAQITPIRKLTRNRGLVLQDHVVEETPEENQASKRRRLFRNQDWPSNCLAWVV
jgi:hypothetical protein